MLKYAILELLAHGNLSGYDVNKRFHRSINFFWHARRSQVYAELKRMHEAGLIKEVAEDPNEPNPRKRVLYTITSQGRHELNAWLRKPAPVGPTKDAMQLKAFAYNLIEPEEAIEQFKHHAELHRERLALYRSDWEAMERHYGPADSSTDARAVARFISLQWGIWTEEQYVRWCEFGAQRMRRLIEDRRRAGQVETAASA